MEGRLQETKIGLTVGKLRSNPSKPVADLAKDIVQKASLPCQSDLIGY